MSDVVTLATRRWAGAKGASTRSVPPVGQGGELRQERVRVGAAGERGERLAQAGQGRRRLALGDLLGVGQRAVTFDQRQQVANVLGRLGLSGLGEPRLGRRSLVGRRVGEEVSEDQRALPLVEVAGELLARGRRGVEGEDVVADLEAAAEAGAAAAAKAPMRSGPMTVYQEVFSVTMRR